MRPSPGPPPAAGSRAVVAWLLFLSTLVLLAGALVGAEVLEGRAPTETAGFDGWLGTVWMASWVGFPLVGAIIVSRRRTVLGWFLLLMGLCIALAVTSSGLVTYLVHVAGSEPHPLVLWVMTAAAAPAFALAPFAIDRFPSDQPATGVWRLVVRGAWLVFGVLFVALSIRPTIVTEHGTELVNPWAVAALGELPDVVIQVTAVLLCVFFVLVVGRTIHRFRRATGVLRAQLKWFVSSLAVFPGLFAIVLLGAERLPVSFIDAVVAVAFFVSFNGMAAAIGIAIFRYRLFEIDRVVSRTVTYLAISAVLLVVYLLGILVSQRVTGPLTGGSDLGVALSTLVAAALFQPVRRRVQRIVDRRFNRARYDAQRTVDAFSAIVRDEVELTGVVADLRRATASTVEPRQVSVWLRPQAAPR